MDFICKVCKHDKFFVFLEEDSNRVSQFYCLRCRQNYEQVGKDVNKINYPAIKLADIQKAGFEQCREHLDKKI